MRFEWLWIAVYGVATMSRLLQMISLFCKRALQKRQYSVKETYLLKEPTNRSHPIAYLQIDRRRHDEVLRHTSLGFSILFLNEPMSGLYS